MATRMLLNNCHQRIGYLSSSHGIEDDAMRKAGWMSALKEQDIIPPESWIGTGTPDMPGGEAAMVELLGRNLQLTAVFAYNDNMAAGALTALKIMALRFRYISQSSVSMIFPSPVTPTRN